MWQQILRHMAICDFGGNHGNGNCVYMITLLREVAEGNVFTPVCDSVHRRGSLSKGSLSRGDLCHRDTPYGGRVGGTHPTEMHSCYWKFFGSDKFTK